MPEKLNEWLSLKDKFIEKYSHIVINGKGTYSLILELERDQYIEIGKLGKFYSKKGIMYTMAAHLADLKGQYHLKKIKRKWHIDYLLDNSKIIKIFLSEVEKNYEHEISKSLSNSPNAEVLARGFGSSDCKDGCPSHLIYFSENPEIIGIYQRLNLKYLILEESDFKNMQCFKI